MENIVWTIQGRRKDFWFPVREFTSKAKAVRAMEADRMPKTHIDRFGHDYRFVMKDTE